MGHNAIAAVCRSRLCANSVYRDGLCKEHWNDYESLASSVAARLKPVKVEGAPKPEPVKVEGQTERRLAVLEARTKLAREILDGRRDDLLGGV